MIIWSSRKIEQAIVSNKFSKWDKVKYYLVFPAVITSCAGSLYILRPTSGPQTPVIDTLVGFINLIINAYITFRGIKICFGENERIDGKMFFERYALLSFPPSVRLIAIVLSFSIIIWNFTRVYKEQFPFLYNHFSFISFAMGPIFNILYFSMTRSSFIRLGRLLRK